MVLQTNDKSTKAQPANGDVLDVHQPRIIRNAQHRKKRLIKDSFLRVGLGPAFDPIDLLRDGESTFARAEQYPFGSASGV
jgi:hypothetical protein